MSSTYCQYNQCNRAVICQPPQPACQVNDCCNCVSCCKRDRCNKKRDSRKKKDKCNKCYRRECECECIEYYPCLRVKCGCISASLQVTTEPTVFTTVGQVITYIYTVTNTGNAIINDPIQIVDDRLGTQFSQAYIMPGGSQSFSRTYTVGAADLTAGSLTNNATAYIQVKRCKGVVTPSAEVTITFGSADVSGTIAQTVTGDLTVSALVTISNSALSTTSAFGVTLNLPFPAGVTSVTPGAPIGVATAPIVSGTNLVISQASVPVGTTYQYQFTYTVAAVGAYQWAGNITTASFDPNGANNQVSNTVIVA